MREKLEEVKQEVDCIQVGRQHQEMTEEQSVRVYSQGKRQRVMEIHCRQSLLWRWWPIVDIFSLVFISILYRYENQTKTVNY